MTNTLKTALRSLTLLILVLALPAVASAQTATDSTTLAAAVLTDSTTSISLTSVTCTSCTFGRDTLIYVDREAMRVTGAYVSGATGIPVTRGTDGTTAATHTTAAVVWLGPAIRFASGPGAGSFTGMRATTGPSGQCTRTTLGSVPYINITTGAVYDCLGVTTAGQWVQTNAPGPVIKGTTVASATSITPTGNYFIVSGTTNPVTTIVKPAGWAAGMCLTVNPTGAFVTDTSVSFNIATTAVVNKVLFLCYDGSKWSPSY